LTYLKENKHAVVIIKMFQITKHGTPFSSPGIYTHTNCCDQCHCCRW